MRGSLLARLGLGRGWWSVLPAEQLLKLLDQAGKVVLSRIPDDAQVNVGIPMDQLIAGVTQLPKASPGAPRGIHRSRELMPHR